MQWHYAKKNKQLGPVEEEDLFRMAREGALEPADLVWNETMSDWAPASSVKGLFVSSLVPPPFPSVPAAAPATVSGGCGATPNSELMERARASLENRWGLGIGVMLLYQVVLSAAQYAFAGLIIAGPMSVGLCQVFMALARRTEARVGQLFDGFNRFGTALAAYLLMTLYILLWTLLLIVPGIIATYAYAMTFFILADDPTVKASDALSRSKAMMDGNKWKLFCLQCRFIGWALLCLLTCGIGLLWLAPYVQASLAHFYDDVRGQTGN